MQNTMLDSAISNSLQLFQNAGFKVRVLIRDNEPWFVAKDVCDCLELGNVSQTCSRLDDDERGIISNDTPSGKQEMLIVSEPGLYSLVGSSKKQEAKAFKRWVNHEVLPSIRKTGKYEARPTVPSYMLESEEERAIAWAEEHRQARLALEAKEREIKSLQAQKDVMRQEYKSNKDFCNELIAKGIAVQKNGKPYALSTLRNRMSPILQEVSHTYRYSISEETVVVDGVERKTPYYHRDVCDMIAAVVTPQWLAKPTTDSITPLV